MGCPNSVLPAVGYPLDAPRGDDCRCSRSIGLRFHRLLTSTLQTLPARTRPSSPHRPTTPRLASRCVKGIAHCRKIVQARRWRQPSGVGEVLRGEGAQPPRARTLRRIWLRVESLPRQLAKRGRSAHLVRTRRSGQLGPSTGFEQVSLWLPDLVSGAGLWPKGVCRESTISLQIGRDRIYAPYGV